MVDIVLACLNGEALLPELLRSLQAQTHDAWRLWIRDDGSSDRTVALVESFAAADARIHLLHRGGPPMGVAGAFGWLLDRVPADVRYVMFADHDDVWLPRKIEITLAAMCSAESATPGPVLVHTDLRVVDDALRVLHQSFWELSGIRPEPVTLRRLIVQNVVTAPSAMLNAPLLRLVGGTPHEAIYQDWWCACVAAAFGRVIAVPEATVLYRQHGGNAVGAKRARLPLHDLPRAAWSALRATSRLREDIGRTAAQAGAFLRRYEPALDDGDRAFLRAYARIPDEPYFARKLAVLRLRIRREHGLWRNLGVLLRA